MNCNDDGSDASLREVMDSVRQAFPEHLLDDWAQIVTSGVSGKAPQQKMITAAGDMSNQVSLADDPDGFPPLTILCVLLIKKVDCVCPTTFVVFPFFHFYFFSKITG